MVQATLQIALSVRPFVFLYECPCGRRQKSDSLERCALNADLFLHLSIFPDFFFQIRYMMLHNEYTFDTIC